MDATGLLAWSPRLFSESYDIAQMTQSNFESALRIPLEGLQDFALTNIGIRICLPLESIDTIYHVYMAYLVCQNTNDGSLVAFLVQQRGRQYVRVLPGNLLKVPLDDLSFPHTITTAYILIQAYGTDSALDDSHLIPVRPFIITADSISSCASRGFIVDGHGPTYSWRQDMKTAAYTLLISPALSEDLGYILFLDTCAEEGFFLILAEITRGFPTLDVFACKRALTHDDAESDEMHIDEEGDEETRENPLINTSARVYTYGQSAEEMYDEWAWWNRGRESMSQSLRCAVVDLPSGRQVFVSVAGPTARAKAEWMPWEVSIQILGP